MLISSPNKCSPEVSPSNVVRCCTNFASWGTGTTPESSPSSSSTLLAFGTLELPSSMISGLVQDSHDAGCRVQGAGCKRQESSSGEPSNNEDDDEMAMFLLSCVYECMIFFQGIIISHVRIAFFQGTTMFGLVLYNSISRHNHVRIYLSTDK